ncbi:MAG: hypothetical protein QM784_26385 [Polyangiaceae bacterium]
MPDFAVEGARRVRADPARDSAPFVGTAVSCHRDRMQKRVAPVRGAARFVEGLFVCLPDILASVGASLG